MSEIWKDIEGYEGLYQVSNLGRVRSLDRNVLITRLDGSKHNHEYKGVLKNQRVHRDKYLITSLCKNGTFKSCKVHRLVAQTFIPNPENKPQVNHIDGNKQNNCVDNLEWVNASENNNHAFKLGLRKISEYHKKVAKEFKSKKVQCLETGEVFNSAKDACIKLKIADNAICRSIKRNGKAGGYTWRYL